MNLPPAPAALWEVGFVGRGAGRRLAATGASVALALAMVSVSAIRAADAQLPGPGDPRVTTLVAAGVPESVAVQRMSWQDAGLAAIPGIARQLGQGFGGAWFDLASGRLTVGVVRSRSGLRSAAGLDGVVRAGLAGVTDVVPVTWPAAELDAVTAALSPAVRSLNEGASTGLMLRTVPPENAVEIVVGSGTLTPAQLAFVTAAQARFGTRVLLRRVAGPNRAVPDSCSGVNCEPPLRGGVALYIGRTFKCTLGFIVRANSDAKLYALTAGHCVRDFPGDTWFANFPNGEGHAIGLGHSANPSGDATTDAGIIAINDPSATGWAPRAEVLVLASDANGGPGTTYDETYAIAGTGTSSFGMRVCKAGAAFGTSCGIVFALNVTGPTGVTGMAEANYHGGHGDSGAPVFAGHIAYGLHESHDPASTADSWDSFYVGITHATDALNVHVAVGN